MTITIVRSVSKCLIPHQECPGQYHDRVGLGLVIGCRCECHSRGKKS